ncbi:MAG: J domain-containing protein [Polyangiaceae bacterium]|nr:J domain-containing protein [Polyangiaceae bacterium]
MRLGKDVTSTDLYAVLGVPRSATPDQIRRAYRLQAMVSHPDLHGRAAEQRMVELNVAACVLLDPTRRMAYDRAREGGPPAPKPHKPVEPFYPWRTSPTREAPAWSSPPPPRRTADRETLRMVEEWRGGPSRSLANLAEWIAEWPPGMHLLVCFSAICMAMLLIVSARPSSLPGFQKDQPLACVADLAVDG